MANTISSDSPLARSIITAFLDFLSLVKLAPGTDGEALEVAVQCLSEVFGVNDWQKKDGAQSTLLVDLFTSARQGASTAVSEAENLRREGEKTVAEPQAQVQCPTPGKSAGVHQDSGSKENIHGLQPMDVTSASASQETPTQCTETTKDSLFEQFQEGLESMGYFAAPKDSDESHSRLLLAKQTFDKTFAKYTKASTLSTQEQSDALSEAYKLQGNWAMSANLYREAIDLYTLAISLCNNNAILFANRAAAHTQIGNSEAAVGDCNMAISIDPNYAKAYSRLGLAYYAQGKYEDAIEKGYKKAMELDPSSSSVRDNLQAARQKLEEQQRERQQQFEGCYFDFGQPSAQNANGGPFSVRGQIPQGLADVFPQIINMATQFSDTSPDMQSENESTHFHSSEAQQSTMDFTLNGEHIPDFAGIMQSVLGAFGGRQGPPGATAPVNMQAQFATPQANQHNSGSSAPARDHDPVGMEAPNHQSVPENSGAGQSAQGSQPWDHHNQSSGPSSGT